MSTPEQRQRYKAHWLESCRVSEEFKERGYSGPAPEYPEFPDDLRGMTCGAKTRAGTPCKQLSLFTNGRCKFHGGMATGPNTEAGKEQARINGRKGGRPRKDAPGETESLGPQKIGHSESGPEAVQKVGGESQMSNDVQVDAVPSQREIAPEKPKSWRPKEVHILPACERCAMFAGGEDCLAVAKGTIPAIPICEPCAGFDEF